MMTFGDPFGTRVTIQFQEPTGEWVDCGGAANEMPQILAAERAAQIAHPKKRVRAVDQNGRLVDLFS